jgi:hypothetical protein
MRTKYFYYGFTIFVFIFLIFSKTGYAKELKSSTLTTGIEDQTGVAITIYNINLGLVKDQRNIKLPEGINELRFMDVASKIIPTSVHIKSLISPDSLRVLEQNYEYDLLNPQKLLDKYVGREVKLFSENLYTEREEIVTAKLLSNNGGPIFQIGDEITFGHPGRIIFPEVPENLISKPTLIWLLENKLKSEQTVEATYLTDGINWRADYVATLDEDDSQVDISGWVTIDNKSGTSYKNARLKLVAGDVNRVVEETEYRDRMLRYAVKEAAPGTPQFREEEFFEYHIYTLQRETTIKDNQTKQINLIAASRVPVKKELVFQGNRYYYYSQYTDLMPKQKVGVYIEIENKKENNLGIPLPKGIVRVYKYDTEGSLQFVGEDKIDHTPKDEKIRVKLGDVFDVVATRKQIEWKKIAHDTYEAAYEILIRNHKKDDITIKVIEPIPGDWTILSTSHDFKKTEASTAEFKINVPKDKEVKLTYRVRMRY